MPDPVETPPAAPAPQPAPAPPQSFTHEYVSELRQESASQRVARQAAEKKAQDAEESAVKARTEAEASVKAANKAADERIIRSELKAVAVKLGMFDLDGLKLFDASKLKLNESGEVEGAEALLEAFKVAKPHLFGVASTGNPNKPPPAGDLRAKKVSDMTPEERASEAKRRGF